MERWPSWFMALVLKTSVGFPYRGFESLSLRFFYFQEFNVFQEQKSIEPEIVDNIDDIKKQNNKNIEENQSKKIWAWIFFIAAVIYGVSPIDLIPDMPVVGWIDDFTIGAAALTNLIQQQFFQTNNSLNKLFKIAKWILISVAVLIILVAILIITLIVKN